MFFFSNHQGLKGTFRNVEDKINSVPDKSVPIQTETDSLKVSEQQTTEISLYLFLYAFSEPIL